jgi:hypothetical protein
MPVRCRVRWVKIIYARGHDRLIVARLHGTARRHTRCREPAQAETAAAVDPLREAAGNPAAGVASLPLGFHPATPGAQDAAFCATMRSRTNGRQATQSRLRHFGGGMLRITPRNHPSSTVRRTVPPFGAALTASGRSGAAPYRGALSAGRRAVDTVHRRVVLADDERVASGHWPL